MATSRDRELTEQRLIETVGRLLARSGFAALGVNARTTPVYGGIPLGADEGWGRIRNAVLVAFGVAAPPAEPAAGRVHGRHAPQHRS